MMGLPAPNLDDRHFQQLVDEAKLLVQRRCPEWTDHNVSDPGVTLIECFAQMVDQLIYRLNQVPARNYVKFLELLGVGLLPPTDAETDVTFWLSAALDVPIDVPQGIEVGTLRTDTDEAITFTVIEPLEIVPCSLLRAGCTVEPGKVLDYTDQVGAGQGFACFDSEPKVGDALLVGLSNPVPRCAVRLEINSTVEGVGVDPTWPPLVWEASTDEGWVKCDVDVDTTGGLNRPGEVVVHVPRGHEASVLGGSRAGWLRCRVIEAETGQPTYTMSPVVHAISAVTVGGTTAAAHSSIVEDEIIGLSEGVPGQRFPMARRPVVPTERALIVEVAGGDGWDEWTRVPNFADSGNDEKHFVLDPIEGEIVFGPAVREADGSLQQYGAVPPKGAPIRIPYYRTGGGVVGNVARGAISVLRTPIPFIDHVENRRPASGGIDAEDLAHAMVRGPIVLRTRNRAVTQEDYEELAREAAPEVARVRAVAAGQDGTEAGTVRVLIVPSVATGEGVRFEDLVPPDAMLECIRDYLDDRRVIGARVVVEPPVYQGMTVVARARARARVDAARLHDDALAALYTYFNPLTGGPERNGWPFGRSIHIGEVYSVLQRVPGVEFVEEVRLFAADPISGERGDPVQRIDVGPNALVFSYDHQLRIEP
jgi:predicted phage baseplate assembly protein